jgi:hypothetical protein
MTAPYKPPLPPGLDAAEDLDNDDIDIPLAPTTTASAGVRDRKRDNPAFLELRDETLDPSRHYRWVRMDSNNKSVVKHKMLGYRLEDETRGVATVATPDPRGDSSIAIGDLILMSCPKEDWEDRMMTGYRRRESILASSTAQTKEMAEAKGITLIQDPDHNRESR